MKEKGKKAYEVPTTQVVELSMKSGILIGSPEDRNNGGDWGNGGWY